MSFTASEQAQVAAWIEKGMALNNVTYDASEYLVEADDIDGDYYAGADGLALVGKLGLDEAVKVVDKAAKNDTEFEAIAEALGITTDALHGVLDVDQDGDIQGVIDRLKEGSVEESTD